MMIREAHYEDIPTLVALAMPIWESTPGELADEFEEWMLDQETAIYVVDLEEGVIGWAQVALRYEEVEGASTYPIAYLEGLYVCAPYRSKGYGRELVASCEAWARSQGCEELASDCLLENTQSAAFHLGVGFQEVAQVRCFVKDL